jgi:putative YpdA family bacillithiol system oxidoreductase
MLPISPAEELFDVLIIGAGPIGIACALECKKKNLHYIVVEKGTLTNSLYNYPLNMRFFSTSQKLEIDNIPFISQNPKPTRNEALEYYRRVALSNDLYINLYERIITAENEGRFFRINSNKQTYFAKNIIISTGFYDIPNTLNVPGEELPKVIHYYKEAHPFVLRRVVVVGASNSAVDAALEIWRKGGEVTMVVRGPEIGERVKYWVKPDIENRIKEGSITAYFNSKIERITESQVVIQRENDKIVLQNDFVVAMTGYRPDFLFLKKLGVRFSADQKQIPTYDPQTMETNVKGIFLAGVICGGNETHKWFIENSRIHATLIADYLAQIK